MRLTRPRFTVRWLMIVVAVAAFLLWGEVRRVRFERINQHLELEWRELASCQDNLIPLDLSRGSEASIVKKIEYIQLMRRKYSHAVRYPWLPVEPDPPEPK